jgi:hypothetical protein
MGRGGASDVASRADDALRMDPGRVCGSTHQAMYGGEWEQARVTRARDRWTLVHARSVPMLRACGSQEEMMIGNMTAPTRSSQWCCFANLMNNHMC